MIGSTRQLRVFAYAGPTDMRKGFGGLSALVQQGLGRDPLSGDVYLFVNRNRQRAKALLWDGTGLCVYAKRLEQGCFAAPWEYEGEGPIQMTLSELALFLEGSRLVGRMPLSPPAYESRVGHLARSSWGPGHSADGSYSSECRCRRHPATMPYPYPHQSGPPRRVYP